MATERRYAHVTEGFMLQIRMHRLNQGIKRNDAAASIGMDPGQWSHQEAGRYATALDTVYAMAEAVGLRITLRPKTKTLSTFPTLHHANRTSFQSTPIEEGIGNAAPITRRVLGKLRLVRRERNLTMRAVANLLHVREQTFSDLERGKKEPSYRRIAEFADVLGFTVGAVPKRHAALLDMPDAELDAVRHLVTSYVNHCVRAGKIVPPHLMDAAYRMDNDQQEEKAA